MPIEASAEFNRFDAALAWFRERLALSDEEYRALERWAHQNAFWMKGVSDLRLVQDVSDEIARALDTGEPFAEFKKRVADKLAKAWGGANPHRVQTIWINNLQRAYNAGRYKAASNPAAKRFRPFWMYDAVLDSKTTIICKERDSTVLSADDPWWDSNYPPLHHRCRSAVRALTRRQAERKGLTENVHEYESGAQNGFGRAPNEESDGAPEVGAFDQQHVDAMIEANT